MIVHLQGQLRAKDAAGCTIDCHGVGYGVDMTATSLAALGAVGSPCAAHIYTHVAEDQLRLFGFVAAEERTAFVALLSASGVGPKLALVILSSLSVGELYDAAANRDCAALVAVPGIGKKKAERLLLDLQGKLAPPSLVPGPGAGQALPTGAAGHRAATAQRLADVTSALVHLGFGQAEAQQAARSASEAGQAGASVSELVRTALRALAPRGK